jgi:polyhydroxyalkanoate synthase
MSDRIGRSTQNKAERSQVSESKALPGSLTRVRRHSGQLLKRFVYNRLRRGQPRAVSVRSIGKPVMRLGTKLAFQPDTVLAAQIRLLRDTTVLWTGVAAASVGGGPLKVAEPERSDGRFRDDAWRDILLFDVMKQSYLLSTRWVEDTIADVRGLDAPTRRKLDFYFGQMADAVAPSNFVLTNPQVLRATVESRGKNLLNGLANLLRDYDEGEGPLPFRMSDPDAFVVGENLASTPGEVVFQNELMQLIQYTPTTDKVHRRPLLVIPPWINKYYIVDLGEKKSFVRYWVEQGHTVFVISWVNPSTELAHKNFEDYMLDGPLAAMDAIEQATGEREINAVGYCIGGTLLGCTLAWMAANGDDRVKSATFLNSLMEFSEVGELGVFIDEDMVRRLEKAMSRQGYLSGAAMATAFNMLRANSLIWSFFIKNYLLGRDAAAFDLLYWNSDSTRLPAAMHSFYLRNMYLHNRLREPGGITLAGTPIDLDQVTIPCYFASAIEDHIAPWVSCYRGSRHLGGPVRFVLGGSGHIAGIINPPAQNKYGYQINEDTTLEAEDWLAAATEYEGSWWPDWTAWAEAFGGGEINARRPGDGDLPTIEPAPGAYVKNEPAPPSPMSRKPTRVRKKTEASRRTPRSSRQKKSA